jgi:hypothetical protein
MGLIVKADGALISSSSLTSPFKHICSCGGFCLITVFVRHCVDMHNKIIADLERTITSERDFEETTKKRS